VSSRGRILIVDDESNARNALADILREEGYDCETASDGFKGLGRFPDYHPDLLLTDLKMPGMDGLELLTRVRELFPSLPVIVMTAFGAVDTAVKAMRCGAVDYLEKPIDTEALLLIVERSLGELQLRKKSLDPGTRKEDRFRFDDVIGTSIAIQQVLKMVAQVAPSRATVLFTGEPGTGKELLASTLHPFSSRAHGPFVKLHCAALPEALLVAELFGTEKGALGTKDHGRVGRLEQAHGGSLFLDEISEISSSVQVRLLRALQDHEFERLGATRPTRVDTRLIAATHRDLREMVGRGEFREDLFYRLNVINIRVPSLRERDGDILPLAMHFLRRFAKENGKNVHRIADSALRRLVAYGWPGNVRELENVMERAVVLADDTTVGEAHLPEQLVPPSRCGVPRIPGASMADIERYAILSTLEAQGGSTSKAADVLGISVRKIQYKLQEYGAAPKSGVPALDPRSGTGQLPQS